MPTNSQILLIEALVLAYYYARPLILRRLFKNSFLMDQLFDVFFVFVQLFVMVAILYNMTRSV